MLKYDNWLLMYLHLALATCLVVWFLLNLLLLIRSCRYSPIFVLCLRNWCISEFPFLFCSRVFRAPTSTLWKHVKKKKMRGGGISRGGSGVLPPSRAESLASRRVAFLNFFSPRPPRFLLLLQLLLAVEQPAILGRPTDRSNPPVKFQERKS